MKDYIVNDDTIIINFDKKFYEIGDIQNACNLVKDKCVSLVSENGDKIKLEIRSHIDTKQMLDEFLYVLSNQQIKSRLLKENGKLRDLIVEHAFKPLKDLEDKRDEI